MSPIDYLKQAGNYLINTTPGRILLTLGAFGLAGILFGGRNNDVDVVNVNHPKHNLEYHLGGEPRSESKVARLAKWQRSQAKPRGLVKKQSDFIKNCGFTDLNGATGFYGDIDYNNLNSQVREKLAQVNALLISAGYAQEHLPSGTLFDDCLNGNFKNNLLRQALSLSPAFCGGKKGYYLQHDPENESGNFIDVNFYFIFEDEEKKMEDSKISFNLIFRNDKLLKNVDVQKILYERLVNLEQALYENFSYAKKLNEDIGPFCPKS